MKVTPDSTLRLVGGETIELTGASFEPVTAIVKPRLGETVTVTVEDGCIVFPAISAPDTAQVDWYAEGAESASASVYVEVVHRHYFELDQLRAYGDGRDGFDELEEETLFAARQAATEVVETNAHRSFVHRLGRTKDYGRNQFLNLAHNDVYEVITPGYHQVSGCQLQRLTDGDGFPAWVEYLYGYDTMPAQISRAVLELAAYTLRPSNRPVGATGESTDAGYIHFTTAGRDGATDIPEVNAAIEQFGAGVTYVW